jgi:LPXTG-motif cell wall-anchored protein
MKHTPTPHRRAAAWLLAAAALPFAPLAAQDVPVVNAPPPVIVAPPAAAPAPPPISVAPPPRPVTIAPPPAATPAPAPAETRATTRTARTATRTTIVRQRAAAPVRQAAPAPAPITAAPEAVPVTTPVAPPEAVPVAPVAPAEIGAATAPVEPRSGIAALWPWLLAGGVLLIAAIALFARRRRRADEEVYYDEPVYEEAVHEAPVVEAAPEPSFTRAAPVAAAAIAEREPLADEVAVVDSDAADVEALAAGSEPVAGRPWLEFLMRPLRAGTSRDDAIVQFELTVGNTGSVSAKDVRISTWMVAGGQGTDMERSLIEPPADANVSELDIAAGDGARVEGMMAMPKAGLTEPVLPVLVADARYTLPDGSEGRTHASFVVGRPEGDDLAPFPIDRSSGLSENVEARLHGEPERV